MGEAWTEEEERIIRGQWGPDTTLGRALATLDRERQRAERAEAQVKAFEAWCNPK